MGNKNSKNKKVNNEFTISHHERALVNEYVNNDYSQNNSYNPWYLKTYKLTIFIESHERTKKIISYFTRELIEKKYDIYIPSEISFLLFKYIKHETSLMCIGKMKISDKYQTYKNHKLLEIKQKICDQFPLKIGINPKYIRLRTVINDSMVGRVFWDNKTFEDNIDQLYGKTDVQICVQKLMEIESFTNNSILLNIGKCKFVNNNVIIYPFDEIVVKKKTKILGNFQKRIKKMNKKIFGEKIDKQISMTCVSLREYLNIMREKRMEFRIEMMTNLKWTYNDDWHTDENKKKYKFKNEHFTNAKIAGTESLFHGTWRARSGDIVLFKDVE